MATLTDKFIRRQKPRGKRSYEISCSSTPGLILRVLPSGKQVLFVRIRGDGRDTKVRLGLYGDDLSLEARLRAVRARSGEPRESHLAVRALVPERRERQHAVAATTMTFDELAREYLARHVNTPNLKPKTKPNYRRAIRVFCDMWGKRPLGQIKFREVEAWHQSKADAPSAANNHLRVLSSMYEKALRWEYYDGRNPARGVKPFKETKRKRYLSKAERRRLKEQLDRSCAEYASKKNTIRWSHAYAIRLLGLTGFRCHEILDLEWDWIDRDNLSIRLPDSKTGDSERPISPAVLDVLDELEKYRRDGVPWVVYGKSVRPPRAAHHLLIAPSRGRANLPARADQEPPPARPTPFGSERRDLRRLHTERGGRATRPQEGLYDREVRTPDERGRALRRASHDGLYR